MAQRLPRSARETELLELARNSLPSGVRSTTLLPEHAMVIQSARGSKITDVSGNEYIDYLCGSGPIFLGHAHPAVVAAVQEAAERGSSYLLLNEKAIQLAEEVIAAVPCAERVCFHGTGSESTFYAMRFARAFRKRDKILKFEGAFHGMNDYALMTNQWTPVLKDYPESTPNSAGIPRAIEAEVLIAPFNDLETTNAIIEQHADSLAGVIVEPLQRTLVPKPGFLQGLREITRHHEIALIFDEVVTGFRLAFGGAQEYYDVVPDLAAVCKGISSGYPISVLCGSEEILSLADPTLHGPGEHVMQTGTFSANPVSCAAALATLEVLKEGGVYEQIFAKGRRLMDGLQSQLDAAGIPAQVSGEPPAFQVWFTEEEIVDFRSTQRADAALGRKFTELLLEEGIIKAHEKFFVSLAHTDEDIERTLDAFAAAIEKLKAG